MMSSNRPNRLTIVNQFSENIADAYYGVIIDKCYKDILSFVSKYKLPEPLARTGLKVAVINDCIVIRAHGFELKSCFDHVWRNESENSRVVWGRLRLLFVDPITEEKGISQHYLFFSAYKEVLFSNKVVLQYADSDGNHRDDAISQICRHFMMMALEGIYERMETVKISSVRLKIE